MVSAILWLRSSRADGPSPPWARLGQWPHRAPGFRTRVKGTASPGSPPGSVWLLRASGLVRAKMHCVASSQGLGSGPFPRGLWTQSAAQDSFLLLDSWASALPVFISTGPGGCPSVNARRRRAAMWPVSQYPPEPRAVPGARQTHVSFLLPVPSDHLHRSHHLFYLWDPLNRHGEDRGKG